MWHPIGEPSDGNGEEVLGAFQQCQEGRCACPTTQYEKLQTLDMEDRENEKAKASQSWWASCL
jgi:hypothetical protein